MTQRLCPLLCCLIFAACQSKPKVDLLLHNAVVYTVNDSFAVAEARLSTMGTSWRWAKVPT
ncbi:hypothetical protein MKQ70_25270 [Chitinophaga sedimenti]|uniref:hypothetical protein n=1 Tax=Chitinophaga sedimenti TaxID=2033606 RepID=UPI002002D6CA|nr:hypothetical protein [Chitinophaga sedimenti]MCK7558135.1 hypothetical protein [Chitinophaga sedimenti]